MVHNQGRLQSVSNALADGEIYFDYTRLRHVGFLVLEMMIGAFIAMTTSTGIKQTLLSGTS